MLISMRGAVLLLFWAAPVTGGNAAPVKSSSPAPRTADVVCGRVAPGQLQIDGLLDDWTGPFEFKNGPDPRDAGLSLRCGYDDQNLYLAVNVSDDRLIRSAKPRPTDDHLVLSLGNGRWEIFPGSGPTKPALIGPKGLTAIDSLQKQGWSVEIGIARARLPGVARKDPALPFGLALHDGDVAAAPATETVVDFGGQLVLEEADALLRELLSQLKLGRSDIRLDAAAEVDGAAGAERVVWAGKYIAILGEGFAYIELPVARAPDVLEVRPVDLGGDGKASLLVRYVERGNGGSREVLAVWNVKNQTIVRTFAHEVKKTFGAARLTNVWELVPKKGKKRGHDLVVRVGEAVGLTRESWNETPAEDMVPILLPWGERKRETWRFDNDEVSGG